MSSRARRHPTPLVLAVLLAALVLAGCGGGGGGGSTSPANPSTTNAASPTSTDGSTTTAALPGTGRPVVTIGDKNDTEQFVLGQLYLQALKAQGFKVNINENIGPPDVTRQALADNSLAMYPEYLDVFDQTLAGDRRNFRTERSAYAAARAWARRHALRLLAPTPFSDTSAIAVTDSYASAHRLRTLADLSHVDSAFVLGGALQFEDEAPGLPTLAAVYGVTPLRFHPVAVGSQYSELDSDELQAAYVYTTDGELATGDYRVLADPHRIFGFGNVIPVVTVKALHEEGPAFAATVERVDRTLTLSAIRALNNAADVTSASPTAIATAFLQTHGLLSPLSAADYRSVTAPAG